jgi:hypothetical protein
MKANAMSRLLEYGTEEYICKQQEDDYFEKLRKEFESEEELK